MGVMDTKTVLVISAHADDHVIGFGGTLAKYVAEGIRVITVVFTYGERSIPYLREDVVKQKVLKESKAADKVLGGSGVIFLGLKGGHFLDGFHDQKADETLEKIILKYSPSKIFTHSSDDTHPDHRVVHKLVLEMIDKLNYGHGLATTLYGFGVWRLFRFNKRKRPYLVVDVTSTFNKKLKAISAFKSQRFHLSILRFGMYLSSLRKGLNHDSVFIEEFQKLR